MNDTPQKYEITPTVRQALEEQVKNITEDKNWIQIAVLDAIRVALAEIRKSFTTPEEVLRLFEQPTWEMRFYVNWTTSPEDLASCGETELKIIANETYKSETNFWVFFFFLYDAWARTRTLWLLTNDLVSDSCRSDNSLSTPISLAAFLGSPPTPIMTERNWLDHARTVSSWNTSVNLANVSIHIPVFFSLNSMVTIPMKKQGYFPLRCSIKLWRNDLVERRLWDAHHLESLWAQLQQQVTSRLDFLGEPPLPYARPNGPTQAHSFSKTLPSTFVTPEELKTLRTEIEGKLDRHVLTILDAIQTKIPTPAASTNEIINVDVDGMTITIKGIPYGVTYNEALVLKVLHDAAPHAPKSTDTYKKIFVTNHVRVINGLCKKSPLGPVISQYIEKKRGKGCWMNTR